MARQIDDALLRSEPESIYERMWAKVTFHLQGCIEYRDEPGDGTQDYGRIGNWRAHRLAWTHHNGPIPEGLYVLHHCYNSPCVNPDHLYVGNQQNNMRDRRDRGRDPNLMKTHCQSGHPFDEPNTLTTETATGTRRTCRICAVLKTRKYRAKLPIKPMPTHCIFCQAPLVNPTRKTRFCSKPCNGRFHYNKKKNTA